MPRKKKRVSNGVPQGSTLGPYKFSYTALWLKYLHKNPFNMPFYISTINFLNYVYYKQASGVV